MQFSKVEAPSCRYGFNLLPQLNWPGLAWLAVLVGRACLPRHFFPSVLRAATAEPFDPLYDARRSFHHP